MDRRDTPWILIVDDVETNRFVLRNIITDMGLQPILAENGVQALRIVERHRPQLILLDVSMPEMDGYETVRAIRKSGRKDASDVPVFAMTANAFAEDISAVMDAGMNGHIAKPIEIDILYETLQEVLKKSEQIQII